MSKLKYILIFVLISFSLVGCDLQPLPNKNKYVKAQCPTFNSKLKIDIKRYNDKYALISWEDVRNIEVFLKKKKEFNLEVKKLNKEK